MKLTKICLLLFAFIILFSGCMPRLSEEAARARLEPLLIEDLAVIIEGIDSAALLEEPYFVIREFNGFDQGRLQYLAVAEFYFLRDIRKKIVRRYRFDRRTLSWDRFYNEWRSF